MEDERKHDRKNRISLTEEEIKGIGDRVYENLKKDLFLNAGKGVIGLFGRIIVAVLVLGAAFYYFKTGQIP